MVLSIGVVNSLLVGPVEDAVEVCCEDVSKEVFFEVVDASLVVAEVCEDSVLFGTEVVGDEVMGVVDDWVVCSVERETVEDVCVRSSVVCLEAVVCGSLCVAE